LSETVQAQNDRNLQINVAHENALSDNGICEIGMT
jgi:hypothetical protein